MIQRINSGLTKMTPVLRLALLIGPIWYMGAVIYIMFSRFTYPFELEWMEGGSLIQMLRVLAGEPIYTRPTLEYVPYIYPPFYYYLSALTATLLGNSWFTPLRLVSLVSSLGTGVLIYAITVRQTLSRYWGILAAGFFAATFQLGGAWFDIARVDMLAIFLSIAALYFLLWNDAAGAILCGLAGSLALLTKQTTIALFLTMAGYHFLAQNRRNGLLAIVSFALVSICWVVIENRESSGWFWFYIQYLPGRHHLVEPVWLFMLMRLGQIFLPIFIAVCLSVIAFWQLSRQQMASNTALVIISSIAMIATTLLSAVNIGAFNNTFILGYVGISLLLPQGAIWLGRRSNPKNNLQFFIYTLLIIQFGTMFFNPRAQLPTRQDETAGREIVQAITETKGEIWIPHHEYLALMAGKKPYAHLSALYELQGFYGNDEPTSWPGIQSELDNKLKNHAFDLVILSEPEIPWASLTPSYRPIQGITLADGVFMPVTGAHMRPTFWYAPQP